MAANQKTTRMVQIALLAGLEVLLAFTPLGYVPIGPVRATTIHIPVIIGGILLGPGAGALLGGVFGCTSILINTLTPTPTSFVFTPFYSVGDASGNLWSLVIALVPRILIGVAAALVYRLVTRLWHQPFAASAIAGLCGSMVNTILVMGGIYLFFGPAYAAARGIAYSTLIAVIGGVISVNGVLEAIFAAVVTGAVAPALMRVTKKGLH